MSSLISWVFEFFLSSYCARKYDFHQLFLVYIFMERFRSWIFICTMRHFISISLVRMDILTKRFSFPSKIYFLMTIASDNIYCCSPMIISKIPWKGMKNKNNKGSGGTIKCYSNLSRRFRKLCKVIVKSRVYDVQQFLKARFLISPLFHAPSQFFTQE